MPSELAVPVLSCARSPQPVLAAPGRRWMERAGLPVWVAGELGVAGAWSSDLCRMTEQLPCPSFRCCASSFVRGVRS